MAGRQVSLAALAERNVPDLTVAPPPPVEPAAAVLTAPMSPAPAPAPAPAPIVTQPLPPTRVVPPSESHPRVLDEPRPGEWVRYDQYERKEARLRPDQYGRLSELSRALNRTRAGRGERITENTLIRVAIDVLLADAHRLTGTNEAELRKSAGL